MTNSIILCSHATFSYSDTHQDVLSCEIIKFQKYSVALELYRKMFEKSQKSDFARKAIFSKRNYFFFHIFHDNFKQVTFLC